METLNVKEHETAEEKILQYNDLLATGIDPNVLIKTPDDKWEPAQNVYEVAPLIRPDQTPDSKGGHKKGIHWGDFKEDHCVRPGVRQFSAILWNIPWGQSWEDTAKRTPAVVRGHRFNRPTRIKKAGTNIWGEFDVPDTSCNRPPNWGRFIGRVQTEWLSDGRNMRLLAPFSYIDPHGIRWDAPKGSVIDGASIPQWLWSIVGAPYTDTYRWASVIHDVYVVNRRRSWEDTQRVFYNAMRAGGMDAVKAGTYFNAVWLYQNTRRW